MSDSEKGHDHQLQHGHPPDHDHDHGHHHGHFHFDMTSAGAQGSGSVESALKKAVLITAVFMVIEIIGGLWSNSLALLSDAGHMATDLGALLLSVFTLWLSKRPSTRTFSFGFRRAEVIGAFVSGLLIWMLSGFLAYEAMIRFAKPQSVDGPAVFWVSLVGLGANLASLKALYHAQKESLNIRSAYLHVLADAAGSVGAMIVGVVIWLTGWTPIDLIISLLVVTSTSYSAGRLIWRSVQVLMQFAPPHVDVDRIQEALAKIDGVSETHDLHVWSLNGMDVSLSVHLVAEDQHRILKTANQVLEERFGIRHTTIQVESPQHFDRSRCLDCQS